MKLFTRGINRSVRKLLQSPEKCEASLISKCIRFTKVHRHPSRCLVCTVPTGAQSNTDTGEVTGAITKRRSDLSRISSTDIEVFRWQTEGRMVTDSADLAPHNIDWLEMVKGNGSIMLRPKSTEEVSNILNYCSEKRLAVVPQGGNTGLVGGSVPIFDEIILSTQLMNRIIDLDTVSGVLTCEAGCILEDLNNYLADFGLMMPLDLGAKGSCHIGGNLSTNAGGLRVLRYGSLHGSVLGLEVVLADGTVLDCMSTHRKDNTGYDLKQIFIGAEGTLGIITKVSITVVPLPKNVSVSFVGCKSFDHVRRTFVKAKEMLGEILSAFEFLDHSSMECVETQLGLKNPISQWPFYTLVETSGSNGTHDEEKLNEFLETLIETKIAADGTVTTDPGKVQSIWSLRESMASALRQEGKTYKYDISLPLSNFYDIVEDLRERLPKEAKRVVGYGHVGDGNLHLNVVTDKDVDLLPSLEPYIFEWTAKHKGSISAEHGLGYKKANYIHFSKSKEAVEIMKRMKQMFDPKGILNPYKTVLIDD